MACSQIAHLTVGYGCISSVSDVSFNAVFENFLDLIPLAAVDFADVEELVFITKGLVSYTDGYSQAAVRSLRVGEARDHFYLIPSACGLRGGFMPLLSSTLGRQFRHLPTLDMVTSPTALQAIALSYLPCDGTIIQLSMRIVFMARVESYEHFLHEYFCH